MIWIVLSLSFILVVLLQIGMPTPGGYGAGGMPLLPWWVLFYGLHHARGPALTAAALSGLALCALGPGLPAACLATQAGVALAALALRRVVNVASPVTMAVLGAAAGGWHVLTQFWLSGGADVLADRAFLGLRVGMAALAGVPGAVILALILGFLERLAGLREEAEWHLA